MRGLQYESCGLLSEREILEVKAPKWVACDMSVVCEGPGCCLKLVSNFMK